MTAPTSACPKKMTYGPCGDVGGDGSCEVPTEAGGPPRCVFLDVAPRLDVALRADASRRSQPALSRTAQGTDRPFIMSELPEDANSSTDIRRVARRLAGSVDAVLFGDANWMRVRLPPSYRARLVQDEGLGAWPGLNARDRNRVALESELLALADIGVAGVHCVTGNHTHSGNRPDAMPVFDLDSTRLASLATGVGLRVSVAASPHTPPVSMRPMRTADKAAAGASVCMIDQPSSPIEVGTFIESTRSLGADSMTFLAVVSVVLGRDDFERWRQYPNVRIPAGWAEAIEASDDVGETGRSLALSLSRRLLAVPGVTGVLLASTAAPSRCDEVADTFASLARDLKATTKA